MDVDKFDNAKFKRREREIEVPELAPFFPDEQKPVIVIQNLTAPEVAIANEAADKSKDLAEIVGRLFSEAPREKIDAILDAAGISSKATPADYSKRLKLLQFGVKGNLFDQRRAVKFASNFPVDFYDITNKILQITGLGACLGE